MDTFTFFFAPVAVVMFGYAAWFFLGGKRIGSVRGVASGPWGRNNAAHVTVRTSGNSVRITTTAPMGLMGVWLSRTEALQCADALEEAAREAVS